jgi:tRNA A-37 threonylcarbamoyl transferase component Bud32
LSCDTFVLDPRVKEALGIADYHLTRRFPSKRNAVYQVWIRDSRGMENDIVIKRRGSGAVNLSLEAQRQEQLLAAAVSVPPVLYYDEDNLVTQFIRGETVCDQLQIWEELDALAQAAELGELLADWLLGFSRAAEELWGDSTWVMGDVNLRNFLISSGKVYGLDFETASPGDRLQDAAGVLAFLLTYDPALTEWKLAVVRRWLSTFQRKLCLSPDELRHQLVIELEQIARRRNALLPDPLPFI